MSEKERTLQSNIAPFGLRMQPELKATIEALARANERSMNAEIVARLEQSLAIDEVGRDITEIVAKLSSANQALEAEVEGLTLQLSMTTAEHRVLSKDLNRLEELKAVKASIAETEQAAIDHLVQKYRDGFEFMARFYAASVSDRVGRDQMGSLLRAVGLHPQKNEK